MSFHMNCVGSMKAERYSSLYCHYCTARSVCKYSVSMRFKAGFTEFEPAIATVVLGYQLFGQWSGKTVCLALNRESRVNHLKYHSYLPVCNITSSQLVKCDVKGCK